MGLSMLCLRAGGLLATSWRLLGNAWREGLEPSSDTVHRTECVGDLTNWHWLDLFEGANVHLVQRREWSCHGKPFEFHSELDSGGSSFHRDWPYLLKSRWIELQIGNTAVKTQRSRYTVKTHGQDTR